MLVTCMLLGLVFFFKQKTAYDLRISDWSSGVCSSDLLEVGVGGAAVRGGDVLDQRRELDGYLVEGLAREGAHGRRDLGGGRDHVERRPGVQLADGEDRKSVVEGKSVSVRVDLGGRRILKTKNNDTQPILLPLTR